MAKIITKVEVVKVPDRESCHRILDYRTKDYLDWLRMEPTEVETVETRYIQKCCGGEIKEIELGFTRQALDALGWPFDMFYDWSKRFSELQLQKSVSDANADAYRQSYRNALNDNFKLFQQLMDVKNASFWRRLKFLFTGRIKYYA